MPPLTRTRAFLVLYVTLGVVIAIESLQTVTAALHGGLNHHDHFHALVLGTAETISAVVFLIPRMMRQGALALLIIFALAFGIHLIDGRANLDLLIYAAAVLFVRVHGAEGYRWSDSAT
ncbi:MAG: hypothetical protein ACHQXA_09320 [Gemmatimonadales bacterium]